MTFDHTLYSEALSFNPPSETPASTGVDDVLTAFETRLWRAAETIISSGASSISVVAETASIVRRHSDAFASFLSGARHLTALGEDGGPRSNGALDRDIARTEERLIRQLRKDLANL